MFNYMEWFSASTEMIKWYLSFNLQMWWNILIDFMLLKRLYSWDKFNLIMIYYHFYKKHWIWFDNTVFFICINVDEYNWSSQFSFHIQSLSAFGRRIILILEKKLWRVSSLFIIWKNLCKFRITCFSLKIWRIHW